MEEKRKWLTTKEFFEFVEQNVGKKIKVSYTYETFTDSWGDLDHQTPTYISDFYYSGVNLYRFESKFFKRSHVGSISGMINYYEQKHHPASNWSVLEVVEITAPEKESLYNSIKQHEGEMTDAKWVDIVHKMDEKEGHEFMDKMSGIGADNITTKELFEVIRNNIGKRVVVGYTSTTNLTSGAKIRFINASEFYYNGEMIYRADAPFKNGLKCTIEEMEAKYKNREIIWRNPQVKELPDKERESSFGFFDKPEICTMSVKFIGEEVSYPVEYGYDRRKE